MHLFNTFSLNSTRNKETHFFQTNELLTFFWINEAYNENDPDTYIENV